MPEGPAFFAETEVLASAIDAMDYFQILKLDQGASPRDIKNAYYRESKVFHPDRFNSLPDEELKERINKIFKRVTEAYVVLRDDPKRAKYISDLNGPDRAKKLRFTEASEAEQKAEAKKAQEEQVGTTPKGRECFKNGMKEFEAKRYEAAVRHLKMALMYEAGNANYKKALKDAEEAWEKLRPKNDFRIK